MSLASYHSNASRKRDKKYEDNYDKIKWEEHTHQKKTNKKYDSTNNYTKTQNTEK